MIARAGLNTVDMDYDKLNCYMKIRWITSMNSRTAIPAIVSMALFTPLLAQSDFEHSLNSHKGNKILLLGEWKAPDLAKWKDTLDSEAIYGHGFLLLTRDRLMGPDTSYLATIRERDIPAFEQWVRQKYGLANSARWAAIGMDNSLIVVGTQVPIAKEFDKILEQKGIKTPLRILRDFLRENPGHIDAMTDLLTEVRRRALHVMPPNPTEDLDTEKDLRTWAVVAAETDKVFSGDWLGIDIIFFRPDKVQPERYSKLMRNVFKKHISKVEQAISLDPLNDTLWNIWAWMAQCIPDYKWNPFINSIEPGIFPSQLFPKNFSVFPSASVCAWLIEESRAKKDWDTVVKFAKAAQYYRGDIPGTSDIKVEWIPNTKTTEIINPGVSLKDYPARAYAAHLEALLRLGNIEEANRVYDEMIRREGNKAGISASAARAARAAGIMEVFAKNIEEANRVYKAENALVAASAAKAAAMEDIARIWEKGEQINKVPYAKVEYLFANGFPSWHRYAQSGENYSDAFSAMVKRLDPPLRDYSIDEDDLETIGWKADDGDRWALIAGDLSVIEQGYGMPEPEVLQAMLKRHDIKGEAGYRRDYMSKHGVRPGLEIDLAFTITNIELFGQNNSADKEQDIFAEACALINKVLSGNPEILINLPNAEGAMFIDEPRTFYGNLLQSPAMNSLATRLLTNIETLLEKKPSSKNLWNQWLFWRWVKGDDRSMERLLESVKASPISKPGTVPPAIVIDAYYNECKKNEKWPKVISILRMVWDREFDRIKEIQEEDPKFKLSAPDADSNSFSSEAEYAELGDNVAIPLIEAYLYDGKPGNAKEIFDAWLGLGGTFNDISSIVELAKKLGQERLAVEWEKRVSGGRS